MAFEPIRTERLILRAPVVGDVEAAYQRRSLPEVARYQDWEMPYTRELAEAHTAKVAAMDGPTDGTGWSVTVVDAEVPDRILGDVYVELKWGGRCGYIGYTFHPDTWGRGYATEAAAAIIDHLFTDIGVSRVETSLHPDNVASARVLEACGLVFEGQTRQSFWVGDDCTDDMLYGTTRADWDNWRTRTQRRPDRVELVLVSADNRFAVGDLVTHRSQERFVPPMLDNFRDVLAPPATDGVVVVPWHRAIEADGEVVGFVMASGPTESGPRPRLRRLLIDRMHQRRGVGSAALGLFEQWCIDGGAVAVDVSWTEGPGSPAGWFSARGYEPAGTSDHGVVLATKQLA